MNVFPWKVYVELHNGDRPTSVVLVCFVLFQGSDELVDLQRLANVKVDLMGVF